MKWRRKAVSAILTVCMLVGMLPAMAMAEDTAKGWDSGNPENGGITFEESVTTPDYKNNTLKDVIFLNGKDASVSLTGTGNAYTLVISSGSDEYKYHYSIGDDGKMEKVPSIFCGSNMADVTGNQTVTFDGSISPINEYYPIKNVYGGGLGTSTKSSGTSAGAGDVTVNVENGAFVNEVLGGGAGQSTVDNFTLNCDGQIGIVYAGGEAPFGTLGDLDGDKKSSCHVENAEINIKENGLVKQDLCVAGFSISSVGKSVVDINGRVGRSVQIGSNGFIGETEITVGQNGSLSTVNKYPALSLGWHGIFGKATVVNNGTIDGPVLIGGNDTGSEAKPKPNPISDCVIDFTNNGTLNGKVSFGDVGENVELNVYGKEVSVDSVKDKANMTWDFTDDIDINSDITFTCDDAVVMVTDKVFAGGKFYRSFDDAVTAVTADDKVLKLYNDAESALAIDSDNYYVDTNGHKFTAKSITAGYFTESDMAELSDGYVFEELSAPVVVEELSFKYKVKKAAELLEQSAASTGGEEISASLDSDKTTVKLSGTDIDKASEITVTLKFDDGLEKTSKVTYTDGAFKAEPAEIAVDGKVYTIDLTGLSLKNEITVTGSEIISKGEKDDITVVPEGTAIKVSGTMAEESVVEFKLTFSDGTEKTSKVTYTDGAFKAEPAEFTVDGKVYTIDLSGLNKTAAEIAIVPAKPETNITDDSLTEEQIADVTEAVSKTETNGVDKAVEEIVKTNEDGTVEVADKSITAADAQKKLSEAGIEVADDDKVTIVVEPYVEINVVKAAEDKLTLNIAPYYNVKATTAESHDKIDDSNSALLYAKQPMNTDSKAIELKLTLPETFKADVSALFVKHTKNSGKVYYYKPEVSERVLTFVNPHGFSEFEVYTDTRSGKIVFSDGAGTKEYTPANIGESLPVAEKSGYKFNGWKIDGKTYTELTDSLLTLISGDSDKTVEATADFTKKSSSGGGGGGGGSSSSTKYEIKVSSTENGKISISSDKASKGSKITVTVTPDNGYKTESVTVKDTDGNKINVTDAGNKKYTFSMPGKSVTVKAEFIKDDKQEKEEPKEEEKKPDTLDQDFRFSDVNTGAWYYNAVFYAVSNGLMSGISDNKFAPDDTLTRAMLVQVLYNMEGRPETAGGSNFSDVAENVWYAKAVEWAQENKIISGIDENTFAPDTAVTREQTASILCRYAGFKGLDITADADLTVFTDNQNISTWAETSVKWAVANKILNGSGTELEPLAGTTRAQMAQILMSFCKMM